jgi:hypothetical protein
MGIDPDRLDKWLRSRFAAAKLFHEIWEEHGEAQARQIFAAVATPTTAKQRADIKNIELLSLYGSMAKPNVQLLARQLAEANKKRPREDRYGPRGSTDPLILDKHIRRLITKRKTKHRS